MHSFLGLIAPETSPFQHRATPTSSIVSGLSQAGEVLQPRDQETSCRQNEDSGYVKAEGRGSITPFLYSPPSPSLRATLQPCLSQVVPPLRNLTRHWLTSHPPQAKQGEVKGGRGGVPTRKIIFVSLVAYVLKVSLLSLSCGGLQLLKPGRVVPNNLLLIISSEYP